MLGYQHLWMAQEHARELWREAEIERMIRQVGPPRAAALHGRALAWLGGQLIAWGQILQLRYSPPAALMSNHSSHLIGE